MLERARHVLDDRRIGRPLLGLAAIAAAVLVAGTLLLRSEPVQAWLRSVTGEESAWEGAKGAFALAMLDLQGTERALEPMAVEHHASVRPYGVNTFLQLEPDPAVVRRSFELMRDAGVGWARQHFPWEDIEIHGRGDFEDRRNEPARSAWDKYDRIVQLSQDYNVGLLGRLDDPPSWAYEDPEAEGPQMGPPSELADWGAFVGEVVGRYCGRVRYWQLWNEPNIYPEWGERDVDPAGYAELLAVGAQAARDACADVVIVSAALAQTTEPGGRNMDDLRYMRALYDAGWQTHFDVLAVQAFGLWTGPTDRRVSPDRTNFARLLQARDIMVRQGDAAKAIWITEFGWNSAPLELNAPYGRVDEATRARYTREAYERIAAEWPFVGVGFLWFLRRPDREWHSRPEGWFRLVEPDWTETPAMAALRDMGLRPSVARVGRRDVVDPAMTLTGPWRPEPRPEVGTPRRQLGSTGAELQLPFRGTGYRVVLAPPEGALEASTELFVVLDGEGRTVTLEEGQRDFGQQDLEPGFHILILRVDRGQLPLEEIVITAPAPPNPLVPLYVVAGVTLGALLALVGGWWRWRRRRAGASA